MLTAIFCKQKEGTKAIVWSVTESRWGSRRMWAGQLSKNFSLFVVYEFARFLYVSHLMFYSTERKWVGDNLQPGLWLWSSLNKNNKKSFVNKSPYFQACTAIVSQGLVRQLYYKYIGAAVDCTLKTALIRHGMAWHGRNNGLLTEVTCESPKSKLLLKNMAAFVLWLSWQK